jgi:hypothetical protein
VRGEIWPLEAGTEVVTGAKAVVGGLTDMGGRVWNSLLEREKEWDGVWTMGVGVWKEGFWKPPAVVKLPWLPMGGVGPGV